MTKDEFVIAFAQALEEEDITYDDLCRIEKETKAEVEESLKKIKEE